MALAEPRHGLSYLGEPALSADFKALPYANADAPRGGAIVYGERGRFDTLNPYTVKGRAPWAVRTHIFESLMTRSWDEAFTLYCLVCETVETDDARSYVEFTLRHGAKFSDGSAITTNDLRFSMEILREEGRPSYRTFYGNVDRIEMPSERRIRFIFTEPDRELPLMLGLMPILSQADWEGRDFAETTLLPPLGSGPYRIAAVDAGERLVLERRDDYWGRDLPINRGLHGFEAVTYLYFRDGNALWEAFKAGLIDQFREDDAIRWRDEYDFPAMARGDVLRGEIGHGRATGMWGLVFNTRRAQFADRRVREALTLALDFEWLNQTMNGGANARIPSYFGNSELGFGGEPTGRERALLTPFWDDLASDAKDGAFAQPVAKGDGRNRKNLRKAAQLLRAAGWEIEGGTLANDGLPFKFEILLDAARTDDQRIASIFVNAMKTLGIVASTRSVDGAQYQARLLDYDYDMMMRRWWQSLSPGKEQRFYFGSDGVTNEGTRNYMGADHPAIDALIDAMLAAITPEDYHAAVRALDRVLTTERYVIPLWYEPVDRFGWSKRIAKPARDPLYGYRPEVWWSTTQEDAE